MTKKLLTLMVAAVASLAVSAASAASTRHHHKSDHGIRHISRTHTQVIRAGFAFGAVGLRNQFGSCVEDEGQGRFRSCSHGGN
jgi:hypothetical protein